METGRRPLQTAAGSRQQNRGRLYAQELALSVVGAILGAILGALWGEPFVGAIYGCAVSTGLLAHAQKYPAVQHSRGRLLS